MCDYCFSDTKSRVVTRSWDNLGEIGIKEITCRVCGDVAGVSDFLTPRLVSRVQSYVNEAIPGHSGTKSG